MGSRVLVVDNYDSFVYNHVQYLGEHSCTTVTYVNNTSEAVPYGAVFDWKLQNPQGAAVNATFTGRDDDLGAGELAPGGTVSGEICFEGYSPGRYVLIFEEFISLDPDRLTWTNDLQ